MAIQNNVTVSGTVSVSGRWSVTISYSLSTLSNGIIFGFADSKVGLWIRSLYQIRSRKTTSFFLMNIGYCYIVYSKILQFQAKTLLPTRDKLFKTKHKRSRPVKALNFTVRLDICPSVHWQYCVQTTKCVISE